MRREIRWRTEAKRNGDKRDEIQMEVLEYISLKSGCMYISDLPSPRNPLSIYFAIRSAEASAFALEEWNEAVRYITGKAIRFSSGEEAKRYLLSRR